MPLRQHMPNRQSDDHWFDQQCPDGETLRFSHFRPQKSNVHALVLQAFDDLIRQAFFQPQGHLGVSFPKGANDERKDGVKNACRCSPCTDLTLFAARGTLRRFECAIVLRQDLARVLEKRAPGIGKFDAARLT